MSPDSPFRKSASLSWLEGSQGGVLGTTRLPARPCSVKLSRGEFGRAATGFSGRVAPSAPQESPRGLPLDPKSSLGELRNLRKLKRFSWSTLVLERVVVQVALAALVAGEGRSFSLLLRLGCPGLSAAPLRPVGSFTRSILRPFPLATVFPAKLGSGVGSGSGT